MFILMLGQRSWTYQRCEKACACAGRGYDSDARSAVVSFAICFVRSTSQTVARSMRLPRRDDDHYACHGMDRKH